MMTKEEKVLITFKQISNIKFVF